VSLPSPCQCLPGFLIGSTPSPAFASPASQHSPAQGLLSFCPSSAVVLPGHLVAPSRPPFRSLLRCRPLEAFPDPTVQRNSLHCPCTWSIALCTCLCFLPGCASRGTSFAHSHPLGLDECLCRAGLCTSEQLNCQIQHLSLSKTQQKNKPKMRPKHQWPINLKNARPRVIT
jgi:hypothetical protein